MRNHTTTRRSFLATVGTAAAAIALPGLARAATSEATFTPRSPLTPPAPALSFTVPSGPVLDKLADFLQAIAIADDRLEHAIEDFVEDDDHGLECIDLIEAQASCRLYRSVLGGMASGTPTLPASVFQAIEGHENRAEENTPHIESALLALKLADQSIDRACVLSCKLDPGKIDDIYRVMLSASFAFCAHESMLSGVTYTHCLDDVLELILAGRAVPAQEVLRAELLGDYPAIKAAAEREAMVMGR